MVHSQLVVAMLLAYVFIILSEIAESNPVSDDFNHRIGMSCNEQYFFIIIILIIKVDQKLMFHVSLTTSVPKFQYASFQLICSCFSLVFFLICSCRVFSFALLVKKKECYRC